MTQQRIARFGFGIAALALALFALTPMARSEDELTLNISMKDHKFDPAELNAPAGKAIVIILKNLDPAPAEFESKQLRVEKVVTGGGTITMRIRPQEPGRYRFFDDFHKETQGYLVVK
jgi:plastocyanin